jgi:hypothetical protein
MWHNLPWRAEFDEYGGYDCMSAAWNIIDSKGQVLFYLDCGRIINDHKDDPEVKDRAAFIVEEVNRNLPISQ